jgi:hypothetical protein
MQFTTPVPITPSVSLMGYESKILLMGSCFAQNIAAQLAYFGFDHVVNPFGILYQPQALEQAFTFAVDKVFSAQDVFEHQGRFHCFDAHSDLSKPLASDAIQALEHAAQLLREALSTSTHIIITLGSAWQYRLKASGKTVANCHKQPSANFTKELAGIKSITKNLEAISAIVRQFNPSAKIIYTVSPVRHLRDGFVQNMRSKAHLVSGLHDWLDQSQDSYFPAYEIVMDELRDYRFYTADMLHPNPTAIDYIWSRFVQASFDSEAQTIMPKVDWIRKAQAHRPFNPGSGQHRQFLADLDAKVRALFSEHGISL